MPHFYVKERKKPNKIEIIFNILCLTLLRLAYLVFNYFNYISVCVREGARGDAGVSGGVGGVGESTGKSRQESGRSQKQLCKGS